MQQQMDAWRGVYEYLDGRIHSVKSECPHRTPDMSEEAGKAMRAVLREVCNGNSIGDGGHPRSNVLLAEAAVHNPHRGPLACCVL